ncbi:MAG: branched-chain amino acid ABC transporter substrate-binding protein, partial [Chloroflexi bacterium]|nr:branched-chain amino acid ABC transporter substrate-binding protein [Chloroflexota bacterium]
MNDANDIVVGVSLPQTGRYARSAGVYYSRAYDLWIDAVNGRGGL